MTQRLDIIDVSHWNAVSSWDSVKSAGVVGVIFKATEGTSYLDPTLRSGFAAALNSGLACCTYHFFRPGNAAKQMDFYWSSIDPQWGERMVIDYEDDNCTVDELHQAVQRLLDKSAQYDKNIQITVYSGHTLKEQLGNSRDQFLADHTDLWIAQYGSSVSWPDQTYPIYSLWQYSESGSVPGVDGDVDLNEFNGSKDNVTKWIGPVSKEEPVPPPAEVATVDIVAQGAVQITINGAPVNFSVTQARRSQRATV